VNISATNPKEKQLNLKAERMHWLTRKQSNIINRKQTPPIESSTQTIWTYGIPASKSSSAFNPRLSDPF
jgi:hypothetical protein